MLKKMTIGRKLTMFFLLVGIIPLTVVGFLSYSNAHSSLTKEVKNRLKAVVALKKSMIESFFFERKEDAKVLAEDLLVKQAIGEFKDVIREIQKSGFTGPELIENDKYRKVRDRFKGFLEFYNKQHGYHNLFLIDNEGVVVYSAAEEVGFGHDHGLLESWSNAISSKGVCLTDTKLYASSQYDPAIFISVPIYDDGGALAGVIALQIPQNYIDGIMQQAEGMGQTGETYLVGSDYMFRSDSRLMTTETLLKAEANTEAFRESFGGKGIFDGIYGDYTNESEAKAQGRDYSARLGGVPVVGVSTYLADIGWVLVAEVDEAEAFASAYALRNEILFVALIASIIVGIVGFFISKTITKPLNKVVSMVKDIAEGEVDMTMRLDVYSDDELGVLAKWFNIFIEKLQSTIKKVIENSERIGDASQQISAASMQLASGSEEQQAQLGEVAASVEQMSEAISESSRNVGETQENSNIANDAAESGRKSVNEAVLGIEGVSLLVASAVDKISSLEERSREIDKVIHVIDDIAYQTNLLALNANIEAVRAGDMGLGFSVVADEVRKLAERTVMAIADISETIKQNQMDVTSSVQSMKMISRKTRETLSLASQSDNALEEIVGFIANVNTSVSHISAAVTEQSVGSKQISKNVSSVSTVAKQAASGAMELATSAKQLNNVIDRFHELLKHFKV